MFLGQQTAFSRGSAKFSQAQWTQNDAVLPENVPAEVPGQLVKELQSNWPFRPFA